MHDLSGQANGCVDLSSLLGCLLGKRSPAVGEQVVDPLIGPGANLRENIGDVATGVDSGGLSRRDKRKQVRKALRSALRASEEPCFATGSHATQPSFRRAVIDLQASVGCKVSIPYGAPGLSATDGVLLMVDARFEWTGEWVRGSEQLTRLPARPALASRRGASRRSADWARC
jgi:hypothetical protein